MPIDRDHLRRTDLVQTHPLHARVTLNTEDAILAVPQPIRRIGATTIELVVLEEAVQAAAVDHHILRIKNTQAIGVTYLVRRACRCIVRVRVAIRATIGLGLGVGGGHVVWRLGLDVACKDRLGIVELVLVEGVVLDARAPEEGIGAFDVEATAGEDGNLGAVPVVEVVISSLSGVT